ncbi:hypothetical protein [Saccharopolyspora rosea]|uniref:DUF2127 domain-containing protein n=1 Tax=Saccharopolyspora rosea TaxID=524884 RepID=A0ABW3FLM9_9PSEU|nr:hypothetical protein [Saccharopolyspora rosea]
MTAPREAPRPSTVDTSFWAGIASVVVGFGVLATALLVVSDAELRAVVDQLAAQGRPVTLDQARAIYRTAVVAMFVIVAVIAALWILFLFFMRRGRNWARIVITVVGVLWFLLALPPALGGAEGGVGPQLLSLLQLVALLVTLVYAYLAPSNAYFRHG